MAMPFTGHVIPIAAIARALADAGHDVRLYTGSAFRARVEAAGARFVPWESAPDFDEHDLPATFPRLVGKKGLAQVMVNIEDLFIATAPAQLADLRREWAREPWDVLTADEASVAPRVVADVLGWPWATVAVLPLNMASSQGPPSGLGLTPGRTPFTKARDALLRALVPVLARPLAGPTERVRAEVGLPPVGETFEKVVFSRQLVLASGVAALDHGRTDRPEHVHCIGRLAAPGASPLPLPPWWGDLEGRRVVLVSQGTQNVDPGDLIRPALDALADLDVVVATTGIPGRLDLPFAVPPNARVADLVPYDRLLPVATAMVTNGGWGGVLAALEHGIPLVVAGATSTSRRRPRGSRRRAPGSTCAPGRRRPPRSDWRAGACSTTPATRRPRDGSGRSSGPRAGRRARRNCSPRSARGEFGDRLGDGHLAALARAAVP